MTIQSRYERVYSGLPEPVSGYELDPNNGYFSVIIPEATTNLVTNPSVEGGVTTNYTALGGTLAATYNWQAHGACGLALTPAVSTESGFYFGSATPITLAAGATYTASVTIQGEEGKVYYIWIGSTAGALIGTKAKWIGTGHKQRIWVTTVEPAGASRRIYVTRDGQYTDQNVFYADGLQLEAKTYPTTYCDGDQVGFVAGQIAYYWNGTPRASTSTRSAQTRAGGREMKLLWYAFRVLAIVGLGMAPVIDQALPIPGLGEMFQGTGTTARTFTLVGSVIGEGSSGRHLQQLRSSLINAFKPDLTQFDQPLILRYQKCDEDGDPQSESLDILCTYAGGLEGNWDNHQQERIALNFKMHLPFIRNSYSGGVELGYQTTVANANYIIKRGADGVWAAMVAGTSAAVYAITEGADGSIYIGGGFTNLTDANGDYISKWNGTAFSSLGGGADNIVYTIAVGPDGAIYIGGEFTHVHTAIPADVPNTSRIAKWNGSAWSALGTGAADGAVTKIIFDNAGNLIACGSFTGMGGVANTSRIAKWDGSVWTALGTGAADLTVNDITVDNSNNIYAGGSFSLMGGVANTVRIAKWNGTAWVALGTGADDDVLALAFDNSDGMLYAGGDFHTMNGITFNHIAKYNGTIWADMNGGVGGSVYKIYPLGGLIYVGGSFTTAGGSSLPDRGAIWNKSIWSAISIDLPGGPTIYAITQSRAGELFIGFGTSGSAVSATVTITNIGSAIAYPTFYLFGPGRIWQIANYNTGKSIYLNLTLLAGETAILILDPINISFISSFRGNIINTILPGSDFDFPLLPGNNNISAYFFGSTSLGVTAITMSWVNVYWSVDGALFE